MKTLLELEASDCRYPMNDGGPYLFCAETIHPSDNMGIAGSWPYCPKHRLLCTRRDLIAKEAA